MKNALLLVTLLFFTCCSKKENGHTSYYTAKSFDQRDSAFLQLNISDNTFHGTYIVTYFDNKKDSGSVEGSIFGDTLKGRYRFISRNNSLFVQPILFLKKDKKLLLGSGDIYTYLNIPFYKQETIKFNDSSFIFNPLSTIKSD